MDFTALKSNALDRAGLPSSDGLAGATSLGLAVNYAVQRIAGMRLWPWLYSEATANTVADTATLALPVPAYRVHFLAIEDDILDRRQRGDLVRTNDDTGQPNRWAPKGSSSVLLSPTPDAVYAVTFGLTIVEPVLVAGTDIPVLPVQYHDLIVCMAARYLAVRRKDAALVGILDAEIKDWRESLDRAAILANGPIPIRVRQDWGI